MPLAVAYKNAMLDSGPPDAASLHTASPGSTGTNEVAGGSPAYARKTLTWSAASGGSKALAATFPVFDVPASTTVTHLGLWKAGVYQGYVDITDEVFAAQGTYTVTAGSIDLNATASA